MIAVGVNCTAPAFVASLLARARSAADLPLVAYPNDGRLGLGAHGFPAVAVERWHGLGARLIGGCCGIGPDGIRSLAQHAARWG